MGLGSHLRVDRIRHRAPPTKQPNRNLQLVPPKLYKRSTLLPTSEARDPYYRSAIARASSKIIAPSQEKLHSLPVYAALPQIVVALQRNQIVAVNAATGSGKTLLTPKALIDAGFNRVFCMEPTQVATVAAAETVAKIWDKELGKEIGYCHGYSKSVCSETKIIYATNGYQLAYDCANGFKYQKGDVIIFDEAHRPSVAMEFQLAMLQNLREKAKSDPSIIVPKILIMSATINLDDYSGFFRKKIPEIKVPGRGQPITVIEKDASIVTEAISWLRQGKSVMAFLPGAREVKEIRDRVAQALKQNGIEAQTFALNSRLLPHEQHEAIECTSLKFVAATNIAQESLTVKGLEVVIESGLIRTKHLINGVPSLITVPYSQFDAIQQDGRVGRKNIDKKDLLAVAVRLGKVPFSCLDKEPRPAILTSEFAGDVLKLMASPNSPSVESIRRMSFLHRISNVRWEQELKRLRDLGLISPRNHLSHRPDSHGRRAAALPLDVSLAKMVLVAEDLSVANQNINILRKVIDVVSIIQTQGIVEHGSKHLNRKLSAEDYRSEPLTEALLLHKGIGLTNDELQEYGISVAQFNRARRLQLDLYKRLKINIAPEEEIKLGASRNRHTMMSDEQCVFEAIWTAMSNSVYRLHHNPRKKNFSEYRAFTNGEDRSSRTVFNYTVADAPELVVGYPFTFMDEYGDKPRIVHTLSAVSMISPEWLEKHLKLKQVNLGRKEKSLKHMKSEELDRKAQEAADYFLPPPEKRRLMSQRQRRKSAAKGAKGYIQHKKGRHKEH